MPENEGKIQFALNIPVNLKAEMENLADEMKISQTEFILTAIDEKINKEKKKRG